MQITLDSVCASVRLATAAVAAGEPAPRRSIAGTLQRRRLSLFEHAATDIARRLHDDADRTRFLPHHYVYLLKAVPVLWPAGAGPAATLALAAADDIIAAPDSWPTAHLVDAAVACAAAKLRAPLLLTAAAEVVCMRLDDGQGLTLPDAERLLWAFAVSRTAVPYTATRVARAVAALLKAVLSTGAERVHAAVLADVLWSLAAMRAAPRGLLDAAEAALQAAGAAAPSFAEAEAIEWAFHRSGRTPPAVVRAVLVSERGFAGS